MLQTIAIFIGLMVIFHFAKIAKKNDISKKNNTTKQDQRIKFFS